MISNTLPQLETFFLATIISPPSSPPATIIYSYSYSSSPEKKTDTETLAGVEKSGPFNPLQHIVSTVVIVNLFVVDLLRIFIYII